MPAEIFGRAEKIETRENSASANFPGGRNFVQDEVGELPVGLHEDGARAVGVFGAFGELLARPGVLFGELFEGRLYVSDFLRVFRIERFETRRVILREAHGGRHALHLGGSHGDVYEG